MDVRNKIKNINFGFLLVRSDIGVFLATLIFFILLSSFSSDFLTKINIYCVSRSFSLWIIIGFAQMLTLVVGNMNLSVGAIGGLSAMAMGFLFNTYESPIWLAVGTGLAVGILCGIINGIVITKTGINAFVITLAMASVYTGILLGLTKALSYPSIPDSFKFIGTGDIFGMIPILFFIMLFISILLWLMFSHTVIGRKILATGGNIETARLSGINVNNIMGVFT